MFLELILVFIIIIVTSFNYIVTEKPPWGVVNKVLYSIVLNNCYSLGRPIGLRNYLPLILMVLVKGGNLDRNIALITTIE